MPPSAEELCHMRRKYFCGTKANMKIAARLYAIWFIDFTRMKRHCRLETKATKARAKCSAREDKYYQSGTSNFEKGIAITMFTHSCA